VIEHSVALTSAGVTPGRFPQVGGISFSFDPTKQAIAFDTATGVITQEGDRIQNLVVLNEDGSLLDTVVKDGVLVGDANRTFRTVTLNFLATQQGSNAVGGDFYPFPVFVKENAGLANRVDLRGETTVDLNLNGQIDAALAIPAGKFTFAATGSEQDALAEFLGDRFNTVPFNAADVKPLQDTRIQNLSVRQDAVQQLVEGVPTLTPVGTSGNDDIFAVANTPFSGRNNIIFTGSGNDTIDLATVAGSTIAGNNRIDAGSGNDTIFVNKNDRLFGGSGNDTFDAADGQGGNRMSGGAGDDTFFLGFGDRALGGDGDDKFFVGTGGNNLISGGAGADQFWIFNATAPTSANTVLDFQAGTDVIGFNGAAFGFADLIRTSNNIAIGSTVLATLTGVDTSNLTASNFVFI
jgi:hypothetical protein